MTLFYHRLIKALTLSLLLASGYSHAAGWEYLVETFYLTGQDERMSASFTQLGKDNWELVNCAVEDAKLTCIFKRPAT